jgi:hypothetical protein
LGRVDAAVASGAVAMLVGLGAVTPGVAAAAPATGVARAAVPAATGGSSGAIAVGSAVPGGAVAGGRVSSQAVGGPAGVGDLQAPGLPLMAPSVQASLSGGNILSYGVPDYGNLLGVQLNAPVVGMAPTPDGKGFWVVCADGGIFTFGDATYYGSLTWLHLGRPIVGMAATPDGKGYWMVGSDGGIFTFGDAHYYGSTGGLHLNKPIVGMAPTPDGAGYWLVGADGGIFTLGDAHYYGSAGGTELPRPVVAFAAAPDGTGYWMAEGQPPPSPAPVNPFTPALVNALDHRAGVVSAAVVDVGSGDLFEYRPGQGGITASIVKVQILGTLLWEAQSQGRGLSPNEQALATEMIEYSDNSAATALYDEVGGAPAVARFDRLAGMDSTFPNPAWGLTVTTAGDQVTLLDHLVEGNPLLNDQSRAYELYLMEHVTPSQAWGVSAGALPGTTVALKNGWLPVSSGWTVNSVGWVDGYGRDYLISVLTDDEPSEAYGISSISMIAESAWANLTGG